MTKLAEQLLTVLSSYVGPGMANAVLQAAAAQARVVLETLGAGELPRLLDVVDRHLSTYLRDAQKREACMRELRHAGPHVAPTPSIDALMIIPVLREEDVMRARALMKKLVRAQGFAEERQGRVVEGVVELAGDLLRRGRQGTIVFRKLGSPAGIEVTAFEREKASPEASHLTSLRVNADAFVTETPPHMGTTIRATWFVSPPA